MTPVAEQIAELEQKSNPALEEQSQTMLQLYRPMLTREIVLVEDYNEFVEAVKIAKELETAIRADKDDDIKSAHRLHKSLITKRDKLLDPLINFYETLTGKVTKYVREQERIRLAEEARLREEARKVAEAEAKAKAEEEQLAAALQAEAEGQKELAEEIMQQPTVVAPVQVQTPVVQSWVPKGGGVSKPRTNWKWRVSDEAKVPAEFKKLVIDEDKLDSVAKSLQGQAAVPGIEFFDAGNVTIKF